VLRDEGEAYGHKLDDTGVPVAITRYVGVIRDSGSLNALSTLPAVRASIQEAGTEIRLILGTRTSVPKTKQYPHL
jgi:acetyl esterase/lipase